MNFNTTMTTTGNCGCYLACTIGDYFKYSEGFTLYACSPAQEKDIEKEIELRPDPKVIHERIQLTDNVILYIKIRVGF